MNNNTRHDDELFTLVAASKPAKDYLKVYTVAEADAWGKPGSERLPWVKDTDLVHFCSKSGGHPILLNANRRCKTCGFQG